MPKLLFLVAEDSYFCSHRLNLAIAAKQAGFTVAVATRCQQHRNLIENSGIAVFPLQHFNRGTLNPWQQLLALQELYRIVRAYQPDILHHVAMKPVIFGSFISRICKVPKIINALGGLGYLFTDSHETNIFLMLRKKILEQAVLLLLRWIHSKPNVSLILQNPDDINLIQSRAKINQNRILHIAGAGVDTEAFPNLPPPSTASPINIVCISRMLWDKGIGELVDAARILKSKHIPAKVILYGLPDPQNPSSIEIKMLEKWQQEGVIEWRGFCEEIVQAYSEAHIAVLPSYREGLPKSLLEAASCGRAIVTTDVPGCREVVLLGVNGLLVPPKDANALADALITLCQNETLRIQMGEAGRKRVEQYFSDEIIQKQTLALYTQSKGK